MLTPAAIGHVSLVDVVSVGSVLGSVFMLVSGGAPLEDSVWLILTVCWVRFLDGTLLTHKVANRRITRAK